MERTPSWGIEPVPDRLRVLGLLDTGLLWGNLGVSLLVLVAGTYLVPALSLPKALLAILVGSLIGNAMLGVAGMIGADARVPAMVLMRAPLGQRGSWGPTRAERRAVRRLGDLRAADHRDGGCRALGRAVRVSRAVAVDARLRRRRARARAARPGRLRAPLRPQVRGLGRARLAASTSPGGRSTASGLRRALGPARRGRPVGLAGRRPRRRDHRLVGPARRRLHPLRPRPPERVLGDGGRLPAPQRLALGARRGALLLARPDRPGCAAGRGRRRRDRGHARAPRGDGGRDGRGVRERLLGGRLDAEPRPAGCRSAR